MSVQGLESDEYLSKYGVNSQGRAMKKRYGCMYMEPGYGEHPSMDMVVL